MIMFEQVKGVRRAGFGDCRREEITSEQLLIRRPCCSCLIASAKADADVVVAVHVDDAEVVRGRSRIQAWGIIGVAQLENKADFLQRGHVKTVRAGTKSGGSPDGVTELRSPERDALRVKTSAKLLINALRIHEGLQFKTDKRTGVYTGASNE